MKFTHCLSLFAVIAFVLLGVPEGAQAQALPTLNDCSIASLSGSSQAVLAGQSQNRKYLFIQNTSTVVSPPDNVGINLAGGTAAIGGAGTLVLAPGAWKEFSTYGGDLPAPPVNVINVIGTSGQPVVCLEGK